MLLSFSTPKQMGKIAASQPCLRLRSKLIARPCLMKSVSSRVGRGRLLV